MTRLNLFSNRPKFFWNKQVIHPQARAMPSPTKHAQSASGLQQKPWRRMYKEPNRRHWPFF
jgi:hypothetical protein